MKSEDLCRSVVIRTLSPFRSVHLLHQCNGHPRQTGNLSRAPSAGEGSSRTCNEHSNIHDLRNRKGDDLNLLERTGVLPSRVGESLGRRGIGLGAWREICLHSRRARGDGENLLNRIPGHNSAHPPSLPWKAHLSGVPPPLLSVTHPPTFTLSLSTPFVGSHKVMDTHRCVHFSETTGIGSASLPVLISAQKALSGCHLFQWRRARVPLQLDICCDRHSTSCLCEGLLVAGTGAKVRRLLS